MDWQEGGDRGSLGRGSTLVSRKVRRHKGRWGRRAKQMILGSPPLEKSQQIPVCRLLTSAWPPACVLKPCWDPGDLAGPPRHGSSLQSCRTLITDHSNTDAPSTGIDECAVVERDAGIDISWTTQFEGVFAALPYKLRK